MGRYTSCALFEIIMGKRKIIFFAILALIGFGFLYSNFRGQIKSYFFGKHIILWSENLIIKPSDFEGEIDNTSNAQISWYQGFYLISTNIKNTEAKAYFHKKKSWIRDTTNFKQEMKLQRLNFDLYEFYARKYNGLIQKMKTDNNTTYKDLKKIGDQLYEEVESIQDSLYASGNVKYEIRKRWRLKLDKELN